MASQKIIKWVLTTILVFFSFETIDVAPSVYGAVSDPKEIASFPGEVLVILNPGYTISTLDSINQQLQAYSVEYDTLAELYSIKIPEEVDIDYALALYRSSPAVKAVSTNGLCFPLYTPNDSLLSNQWYLNYVDAFRAWDVTKGSANIVIGVIDGGADLTHPDLVNNLVPGYDFCHFTVRPGGWPPGCYPVGDTADRDSDPSDEFGHWDRSGWGCGCCRGQWERNCRD